jgi:hypothetical protein
MSDVDTGSGEEEIDESGRNATQQEIDERGASDAPVDVEWDAGDE